MSHTEKKLEFDKIYNKLLPQIDKMYNSYSFLGLTYEKYRNLIKSLLLEIYNKNNKEKIDIETYLKKLKSYLEVYIKMTIQDSNNTLRIINNFINEKLSSGNNKKDPTSQVKKLSNFLEKYDCMPTPDICFEIIKSNTILSEHIKAIVDKKIEFIKKMGIEELDSSTVFITLIAVYCMIHDIDYQQEEKSSRDEKFEFDSSVLDQLGAYLIEIQQPLLTEEEERELLLKATAGNKYAREKLIERNLRWVVRIARGYQNRGMDLSELIQEGNIGLITAIDKFDCSKGYRLTTYATHWIRQAIGRALHDKSKSIRLPVHIEEKISKYRRAYQNLEKKLNRAPTLEELSQELKISVSSIEEIISYQYETVSLNHQIGDEEDTELGSLIPSSEETPEEQYEKVSLPEAIKEVLARCNLTEREMTVLMLRNGMIGGSPKTLEEIGEIYGVTRERIRQIENKALKRIRRSKEIRALAQLTSNPDRALENIGAYRTYYNTIPSQHASNRSLQKKGIEQIQEEIQAVAKQSENTQIQVISPSSKKIETPTPVPTVKTVPQPYKAVFTIFDTFSRLGYTKDEVLSVLPELPNLDQKRLQLRNGPDLDNPQISPQITERDRNLYITKTLPTIEQLLKNKYGLRKPNEDANPDISIYDKIQTISNIKRKCREFIFPKNIKSLLQQSNLTEMEIDFLMSIYGISNDQTKPLEEIIGQNEITEERIKEIELSILEKLNSSYYYQFFVHKMKTDEQLTELEIFKEFQIILELTNRGEKIPTKLPINLFEMFGAYGYTKEEVLLVMKELSEKDIIRIQLMNGDDLNNPKISKYITYKERELYEQTTIPVIKKLLKAKYGFSRKRQYQRKTNSFPKEEKIMKQNNGTKKYNIFEYFELFGYTKKEVTEVLLQINDREKEYVEARMGKDYLTNPQYNKTVTKNQHLGYARLLKSLLSRLKEKYGDRKTNDIIIEEQKQPETPKTNLSSPNTIVEVAEDTQNNQDQIKLQPIEQKGPESQEAEAPKQVGKIKKTIFEKFTEAGYTKEEIKKAISVLSEEDLNTIHLIDGIDLDNPKKSPQATPKDRTKYYATVLPKIGRRLKSLYGPRNTTQNIQEKPILPSPKPKVNPVDSPNSNSTNNTVPTTPKTSETKKEMSKDDYIRILELLKTVEFENLMQTLGAEKATIIALRLGYIKGKYYSVEAISNFLGIEQSEVIKVTSEILDIYKQRLNNLIDTAVSHLEPEGPVRKLVPENSNN